MDLKWFEQVIKVGYDLFVEKLFVWHYAYMWIKCLWLILGTTYDYSLYCFYIYDDVDIILMMILRL